MVHYDLKMKNGEWLTSCETCLDDVLRRDDATFTVVASKATNCHACGVADQDPTAVPDGDGLRTA